MFNTVAIIPQEKFQRAFQLLYLQFTQAYDNYAIITLLIVSFFVKDLRDMTGNTVLKSPPPMALTYSGKTEEFDTNS